MEQPASERSTRLVDLVRSFRLDDLLTTRLHSRDFTYYRCDYLLVRVRLFALLFGIATPLWIPVDSLLLPPELLAPMAWLRVITGALFLLLAALGGTRRSLWRTRAALLGLFAVPAAFYLASRLLLGSAVMDGGLIGYTFLPFVLIAGGALFPLTFGEGLSLAGLVFAPVLAVMERFEGIEAPAALGTLWLMLLLTGIALWAQSAQLHMLLGLYRQATRDGLTGLFNRRALFRQLDREMARSRRHGSPLAMLLVDLDRFKRINDHYGHPVGDEALRQMAGVLVGQCRTEDLLGRYGGEEFMVVAANTDGDGASRMAERIRAGIEARTLATAKGELSLTASIGVTGWQPGETLDLLVARADAALLQAKEAGRNRVVRLEELPEDHLPLVQPEQP